MAHTLALVQSRLNLPTSKELQAARRRAAADDVRLERLSRAWRTRRQLARLEENPRGPRDSFSFAVLGDAEPGRFWVFRKLFNRPGVFERQLRRVQAEDVDFTMQLGDMVSRGIRRNYLDFFRRLENCALRHPYLTVIGNHDRRFPHGRTDCAYYRRSFGRTNYAFDRGPARLIVLDTSLSRVGRGQLRWLERQLDTERRKIVFTHIPPASLKVWPHVAGARGVAGFKKGARELTGLFAAARVDRVYMGHIHAFGVQDYQGVRYVLSGGGGSPLFPAAPADRFHHTLTVTVGPDGVRERVRCDDGREFPVPTGPVLL